MLLKALPIVSKNTANFIGLVSILLWSMNVGLIRTVTESFGAIGGAALLYTCTAILLFLTLGMPKLNDIPKAYLWWGSLLFIACELSFSLSIGFAQNNRQAIEAGMILYLWPTCSLVFAIMLNGVKANFLIVPGFILAFLGIGWILAGDQGLNFAQMWSNIQVNPVSYGLAFSAAILWGLYCAITAKVPNANNALTLFFILTALVLWIKYWFIGGQSIHFTYTNTATLVMAACALGFGYAAWNIGISAGNMPLLVGLSYFIPVLSAVFATLLLSTSLSFSFWQGVCMVISGAILCWFATRNN